MNTVSPWRRSVWTWYALAAVIVALDLITKRMATEAFQLYERYNVMPMFDLTLRHNYGAAFSFLADQGGWQVWFFTIISAVVSVGIAIWIARIAKHGSLEVLALSLILAGAVGNLYDRATLGYVVDFILVYYTDEYQFPAFNIADSSITLGVIVMIVDTVLNEKKRKQLDGKQAHE